MRRTVNEIIQLYLNKGLPTLKKKLNRLERKDASTQRAVLCHHASDSVREFLDRERNISIQISHCKNVRALADLVRRTFCDIPGIGESTLNSYIYHQAFIYDIPIDESCEVFLAEKARNALLKKGITFGDVTKRLQGKDILKNNLSPLEYVDMINKYNSLIKDYPFNYQ